MTIYMRSGTAFRVSTEAAMDAHDVLPTGTYVVEQNPMTGEFYLDRIRDLEVVGKVYGDATTLTTRILNTFMERADSTGVLLTGEKGSGKTLQAKLLSTYARDTLGAPTILVNRPYRGDGFNQFMQMIDQPVVVLFDEFEKVYDRDEQQAMLTLLDGVYPSKKLFVLTCNDKYRINEQMRNRPGRLFYRVEYTGLEDDFIRQYSADNLSDPSEKNIGDIISIAAVFGAFNFDMLKALVEEMNRYGESAKEASKYLNARPSEDDLEVRYAVELFINSELVDDERLQTKTWSGNPIDNELYVSVVYEIPTDDAVHPRRERAFFSEVDLKTVELENGHPVFRFENEAGYAMNLRRSNSKPAYSVLF